MMIIWNNQLNARQFRAVNDLADLCYANDGGIPTLYDHLLLQKRSTENNVLYLQEGHLAGFLSVYFFYEDACEISLLVSPLHRRQSIAKGLLQTILPLLQSKGMKTLIFSTPTVVNNAWLTSLNFHYRSSEYHMERNSQDPIFIPVPKLNIQQATFMDIPALYGIDKACFSEQQDQMLARFSLLLNDNDYTILLATHENKATGKAHIHWQPKKAVFSDIAILPPYQKQGLGGELVAFCINYALKNGTTRLTLDVEASNHHALNLYARHDFKIINVNDYWEIPLDQLTVLFKLS